MWIVSPVAVFRCLIIVTLIAGVASCLASIFPGEISQDWQTIAEWNGHGGRYDSMANSILATESTLGRIAWIGLLSTLLLSFFGVYVGLFLFWRFARTANLLFTIAFLLLAPWAGLSVVFPIEATLAYFATLCEGALIALSFSSPMKQRFAPDVAA